MRSNFIRGIGFLLVIFMLTFGLQSCGGGGGGSSSSSQVKTTPITSVTQAKSVASSALNIGAYLFLIGHFSPSSLNSLRSIPTNGDKDNIKSFSLINNTLHKISNAILKTPLKTTNTRTTESWTENCKYGGNATYNVTYDNSTNYLSEVIKNNSCNDDNDSIYNGIMYVKGYYYSSNNFNLTLIFDNYTYNALDGSDNNTFKNISYKIDLNNSKLKLTSNGSYYGSWVNNGASYSLNLTFNNLTVTDTATNIGDNYTINGIVTYNLTPPDACEGLNGTYEYKTIEPVEYDDASDLNIAGDIEINDNTEIKWHSDGSIDIYYNNKSVFQGSEDDVDNFCPAVF